MPSLGDRISNDDRSVASYLEMEDDVTFDGEPASPFALDAARFAKALDLVSVSPKTPANRRTEIFKLVDIYYEFAIEQVNSLRRPGGRSPKALRRRAEDEDGQDSMELDEAEDDAQDLVSDASADHWELEAQTWDLLRRLLPLRYPDRKIAEPKRREPSRFQNGSDLWEDFLQEDSTAQERKAILECLQQTADVRSPDIDEMVRDFQRKADRGDMVAFGWLHTRTAIKKQKSVHGWSGALDPNSSDVTEAHTNANREKLATQLDPDVVTRQERKLQPQDEFFERAIWIGCYELLRRGRSLSEIRDWCIERTEVWRAVSMSAMPLPRDNGKDQPIMDPLATLMWRRTSFALARQGGTDEYERAVYGILSGDINSVQKVCKTWDDFVFTHYNALLRTQFDNYVIKRTPQDITQPITQTLTTFDAVQFHGDAGSVGDRLVGSLETNPATSKEAKTPMKALQAAVISDNLSEYIYNNGLVLGRLANQKNVSTLVPDFGKSRASQDVDKYFSLTNHNQLRILVHVYLLLSALGEIQGVVDDDELRRAQENVVASYVSVLRLKDLVELLPLYCSKLKGERAFYTLSRNFSRVIDVEERKILLRIMEKLEMDIAEFVVFQPKSILRDHPENVSDLGKKSLDIFANEPLSLKYGRRLKPDFLGDLPDTLDHVDEQLIQSLEWMMLVDGLWDETFTIGVKIYKRFLKYSNFHAARALAERVKCAEIFRSKAGRVIQDETDLGWFTEIDEMSPLIDEEGSESRDMTMPRNYLELECLVRALDSMETIASSSGILSDPSNPREQIDRDFWTGLGGEVKVIKSYMQPLLKGWLKETVDEDPDFEMIREMYLPDMMLGYVSVLHFAGTSLSRDNFLECMELAALIAEKDSDVASIIMKTGRMDELVKAFANCSKALAISASDKKSGGGSSKKMRELGWSRELWSVKP